MQESSELEGLLPYYVYLLMEGDTPFYVGKGKGNRAHNHADEVKRALKRELEGGGDEMQANEKIAKIKKILADEGRPPVVLVVGRFETEYEALSVETVLINFVYGRRNLCNISRGRGAKMVRPRGCLDQLEGIDIPRRDGQRTGEFRNAKIALLQEANAYDLLNELHEELERLGFNARDFRDASDRRFDPSESNGWLGILVRLGVDFMVRFSHTKKPTISVANTEYTRSNLQKVRARLGNGYQIGEPKNQKVLGEGRYRDVLLKDKKLEFTRLDSAIQALIEIKSLVQRSDRP